jgi:type IV pilus assembly protein PilW
MRRVQAGLTLVELMVAVALNLLVVAAAAYLYLSTRSTQRAADDRASLFESGQVALEMMGRDVAQAGFYPAVRAESDAKANVINGFGDVAQTVVAYQSGVFGCAGQRFDAANQACADHASLPAKVRQQVDGLVINYYTDDAMSLDVGGRADCARSDAAGDAANLVRLGLASRDEVPSVRRQALATPVLVSNRYTLTRYDTTQDGQAISTYGLACSGNGGDGSYNSLVPGIEQLRIQYGVRGAADMRPSQFLDANAVSALSALTLSDAPGDGAKSGWQRVVAIKVCLVVRAMSGGKLSTGRDAALSDTDCWGNALPSDRVYRKRMEQSFAVKNNLTATY